MMSGQGCTTTQVNGKKEIQPPRYYSSVLPISRLAKKCKVYGQLILRKIVEIVATRCNILKQKSTKWCCHHDSHCESSPGSFDECRLTERRVAAILQTKPTTTRFPMSLRQSSYVAPKSPKGDLKNAKRPIFIKKCTSLEESLLQSFFV